MNIVLLVLLLFAIGAAGLILFVPSEFKGRIEAARRMLSTAQTSMPPQIKAEFPRLCAHSLCATGQASADQQQ